MFGENLALNSWINPLPHPQTNMFFLVLCNFVGKMEKYMQNQGKI
jgi:hypothetical protein